MTRCGLRTDLHPGAISNVTSIRPGSSYLHVWGCTLHHEPLYGFGHDTVEVPGSSPVVPTKNRRRSRRRRADGAEEHAGRAVLELAGDVHHVPAGLDGQRRRGVTQFVRAQRGRLEHLRWSVLAFGNLTDRSARSLLEAAGFRPQRHPQLSRTLCYYSALMCS